MMTIGIPTGCTAAWRVDDKSVAINPLYRGLLLIGIERERQINQLHYDSDSDRRFNNKSELAIAAACYALPRAVRNDLWLESMPPHIWPWGSIHWKPASWRPKSPITSIKDRIRELEKAGALIAAEIDRLLDFYNL